MHSFALARVLPYFLPFYNVVIGGKWGVPSCVPAHLFVCVSVYIVHRLHLSLCDTVTQHGSYLGRFRFCSRFVDASQLLLGSVAALVGDEFLSGRRCVPCIPVCTYILHYMLRTTTYTTSIRTPSWMARFYTSVPRCWDYFLHDPTLPSRYSHTGNNGASYILCALRGWDPGPQERNETFSWSPDRRTQAPTWQPS